MNKELETIIENEFDCLINDLGCLIGEEWKAEAIKKAVTQAFVLGGVSKSLNATYKKGDNVILDTGLKAEILGFKNNLAIVLDERGLKFYKQLHKIKHQ